MRNVSILHDPKVDCYIGSFHKFQISVKSLAFNDS